MGIGGTCPPPDRGKVRMKILFIAPENTVGQLELWQEIHASRGNECRYITFFPSANDFKEDICLNLPLIPKKSLAAGLRHSFYKRVRGPKGNWHEIPGNPPIWKPNSTIERLFFAFRNRLWRLWVEPAIRKYGLLDFDIYHFESGMEFYRDGNFIKRLAESDKTMLAIYHGTDFRHRGVIPAVDRYMQINLTSEYDLISRHPNMHYLYLPFDVQRLKPSKELHDPITICHATRNRYAKGSDKIIAICKQLEASHNIRFLLIENKSHAETIALKIGADIYVDQINDVAPGYGMNSVEAMALGMACCTSMNAEYEQFMPDHPFVNVNEDNLLEKLTDLVEHPDEIRKAGAAARRWAEKHHSLQVVGDQLYGYYRDLGAVAK